MEVNGDKCNLEISSKELISCYGPCGRSFHYKCMKLTKSTFESLNNNKQIKFVCDICEEDKIQILINKVNVMMEFLYKLDMKSQTQELKINIFSNIKNVEEVVSTKVDNLNLNTGKTNV